MNSNHHSFYLAPILGVTDAIYRNTFEQYFGVFDKIVAPFITTVKGKKVKKTHLRDILPYQNDITRLIPQAIGTDPFEFLTFARSISDLGYSCVNWNLGCPFPAIRRKGRGSGMLPHYNRIQAFLDTVIPRIPCKLSIKIRLGLKTPEDILQLIPIFNTYPLQEIIIHARTAEQMYDGNVDIGTFKKCLSLSTHPLVYNGDIFNPDTFATFAKRFQGCTRWMSGRGILMDPFLLQKLRGNRITADRFYEGIYKFHMALYRAYNEAIHTEKLILGKMKQLWHYLSNSFPDSLQLLQTIYRIESTDVYEKTIVKFFSDYIPAASLETYPAL